MEIKENEFVRTDNGIFKVTKIDGLYIYLDKQYFDNQYQTMRDVTFKERILKHSFNIIDLIEVGDYINEYKVLEIEDSIYENSKRILIYKNNKESYERWIYIQEYDGKIHTQDDIETILTKEQYQANCYTVEAE